MAYWLLTANYHRVFKSVLYGHGSSILMNRSNIYFLDVEVDIFRVTDSARLAVDIAPTIPGRRASMY